jgi:hypothetical protein
MIRDDLFPDYDVLPVDQAPRDGTVCMVRGDEDYAAAHFAGGVWRLGRPENQFVEQLDFTPTHWLRPPLTPDSPPA